MTKVHKENIEEEDDHDDDNSEQPYSFKYNQGIELKGGIKGNN